jgi:hypothetical protein
MKISEKKIAAYLLAAQTAGTIAFKENKSNAPCQSKAIMDIVKEISTNNFEHHDLMMRVFSEFTNSYRKAAEKSATKIFQELKANFKFEAISEMIIENFHGFGDVMKELTAAIGVIEFNPITAKGMLNILDKGAEAKKEVCGEYFQDEIARRVNAKFKKLFAERATA